MKGILLAGGFGTRLYPLTSAISKQALPIYDKPMIYYPLSVLMLADIRDILIISTKRDIIVFKEMFGNGNQIGINLSYKVQDYPNGIAEALIISEDFIGDDNVCLILGDNFFYGDELIKLIHTISSSKSEATIFGYKVFNPKDFSVVEFDKNYKVLSIEEKPLNPKSNYVIPGIFIYNKKACSIARNLTLSKRGKLEITDVNLEYLKRNKLNLKILSNDVVWLDIKNSSTLLDASILVQNIQSKESTYIASLEEIAYKKGYITKNHLSNLAMPLLKTDYGIYLKKIVDNS
ncbi:glucose-1-phosphate thymidylyltransferase RfbA [Romboutsia sp. CE17]|uniref:glucose-1-phosphate thymidylyltransferase RfbA n=1 Tax=Romboutsia sp. CE17 TaxID=2724150 RepID=UPI001442B125|nr:glucose-1-phosphate thymidylyltransferase RfbA [Romboutsia sp. CE17]QJA08704.1 glucose-1-phosphate thymidylyltransferase RfbA [Romboutsia sp. CE17]